jgi:hypothetical protein
VHEGNDMHNDDSLDTLCLIPHFSFEGQDVKKQKFARWITKPGSRKAYYARKRAFIQKKKDKL